MIDHLFGFGDFFLGFAGFFGGLVFRSASRAFLKSRGILTGLSLVVLESFSFVIGSKPLTPLYHMTFAGG